MAAKRGSRRPPPNGGDPTTIVLEDMRAQNKMVIEAVQDLGRKIERDIGSLRSELLERIAVLEAAQRQSWVEIREVKDLLTRKADAASLAALEQRVAALERRAGSESH